MEINMYFLGAFMAIVIGLMAYMTKAVVDATKQVEVLKALFNKMEDVLEKISSDLRIISTHDSLIAVLNSQVDNMKGEISLIFEKFRELEKRELERNEKRAVHR